MQSLQSGSTKSTGNEPKWTRLRRPGYFGRRKDQIIADLNAEFTLGGWELRWVSPLFPDGLTFDEACILYYEHAYLNWFKENLRELDFISKNYGECIDNAMTNIQSGRDYRVQEAYSTHIQDIAVRNALWYFGYEFQGPKDKILVIRSADSDGFKYGPGNIPFHKPEWIEQPSLCPHWANTGSVEDFWQSNKILFVRK